MDEIKDSQGNIYETSVGRDRFDRPLHLWDLVIFQSASSSERELQLGKITGANIQKGRRYQEVYIDSAGIKYVAESWKCITVNDSIGLILLYQKMETKIEPRKEFEW